MLTLRSLETFQAVVRLGSMTAAAGELSYAVNTVSTHVKQVTAHFGEPLLERAGARYVTTALGRQVAHEAAHIVSSMGRLDEMRTPKGTSLPTPAMAETGASVPGAVGAAP